MHRFTPNWIHFPLFAYLNCHCKYFLTTCYFLLMVVFYDIYNYSHISQTILEQLSKRRILSHLNPHNFFKRMTQKKYIGIYTYSQIRYCFKTTFLPTQNFLFNNNNFFHNLTFCRRVVSA